MNYSIKNLTSGRGLPVFFSLLVIAFLSRYYGLWEWGLVSDEHFTVGRAEERYASLINPAYYSLVVLTQYLFGQVEWIARVPSFILGVISIPILYLTWSRLIGRNAALLAAMILVFSAWHLWHSQFARFYTGVFIFGFLAYAFFYSAIITDKITDLLLALLFSLVATSFHVTAVFVPASSAVAYFFIFIFARGEDKVHLRTIKIYLFICLALAIATLPFFFKVLNRWQSSGQTWGHGPILIIPQLVKYIQIPICISAIFGWLTLWKTNKALAIFFTSVIGAPVAFLVVGSTGVSVRPDYVIYILAPVVLLSGIACEESRKLLFPKFKFASLMMIALIAATLVPEFGSHYLGKMTLRFGDTVEFVDKQYQAGDQILSSISGFKRFAENDFNQLPYIGSARDSKVDWNKELGYLLNSPNRTWIVLGDKRQPFSPSLKKWLFCHASLVRRDQALRLDYEVDEYQVYLVAKESSLNGRLTDCH